MEPEHKKPDPEQFQRDMTAVYLELKETFTSQRMIQERAKLPSIDDANLNIPKIETTYSLPEKEEPEQAHVSVPALNTAFVKTKFSAPQQKHVSLPALTKKKLPEAKITLAEQKPIPLPALTKKELGEVKPGVPEQAHVSVPALNTAHVKPALSLESPGVQSALLEEQAASAEELFSSLQGFWNELSESISSVQPKI